MTGAVNCLIASRNKTQVAFGAAGAGTESTTGTLNPAFPASCSSLQGLILHVEAAGASLPTISPNDARWTLVDTRTSGTTFRSSVYFRLADGTESGTDTVTITGSGSNACNARIYRTSAPVTWFEGADGQANAASSTTIPARDITSTIGLAMACQVFFAGGNTTITDITGESGTDYTEAVAEYSTASGRLLSFQTGAMATPGAITGGTATLGVACTSRITHGFFIYP